MFEIRYYIVDSLYINKSLTFCWFMITLILFLIALTLIIWAKYFKNDTIEKSYKFRELFSDLKGTSSIPKSGSILSETLAVSKNSKRKVRKARLFTSVFLVRRLLLILMIVTLDKIFGIIYRIICYAIIQALYIVVMLVINPFENKTDNVTLKINEFAYLLLILSFFYLHDASSWNSIIEVTFISFIMTNNIIV